MKFVLSTALSVCAILASLWIYCLTRQDMHKLRAFELKAEIAILEEDAARLRQNANNYKFSLEEIDRRLEKYRKYWDALVDYYYMKNSMCVLKFERIKSNGVNDNAKISAIYREDHCYILNGTVAKYVRATNIATIQNAQQVEDFLKVVEVAKAAAWSYVIDLSVYSIARSIDPMHDPDYKAYKEFLTNVRNERAAVEERRAIRESTAQEIEHQIRGLQEELRLISPKCLERLLSDSGL